MKKLLLTILILCFIAFPINGAMGAAPEDESAPDDEQWRIDIENTINDEIMDMDFTQWDQIINDNNALSNIFQKSARQSVFDAATGNNLIEPQSFFDEIIDIAGGEFRDNLGFMLMIIVLAVISSIVDNLQNSFASSGIAEIANIIPFVLIMTILMQMLGVLLASSRQTMEQMVTFMQILFPVILGLLSALGSVASAGVYQPAMALLSNTMATFYLNIVLPIVFLSIALIIVSNVSGRIQLGKLGDLSKSVCKWLMGVSFTVFIGITTIQGITAAAHDGISIRTTKFAIDKFVPVVGGMVSDTVDTVIGCSMMVKNAVGVGALVIIAGLILVPVIKIAVFSLMLRLSAALIEPIASKNISNCLSGVAGALSLLLVCVLAVALMFFILVALVIMSGNINMMMR